jgi:hypothetical protein
LASEDGQPQEAAQFIIDNELTSKTSDVIGGLHLMEY